MALDDFWSFDLAKKKNNGRGGMLLRFQWSLALDLIDSLLLFFF